MADSDEKKVVDNDKKVVNNEKEVVNNDKKVVNNEKNNSNEPKKAVDEVEVPEIRRREDAEVAFSPIFEAAGQLADDGEETADSFDETDFDDQFDDDFEEEIEGEYELEDDHYGEEFSQIEEAMGMKKSIKKKNDQDGKKT